jgi:hypothetical protein
VFLQSGLDEDRLGDLIEVLADLRQAAGDFT